MKYEAVIFDLFGTLVDIFSRRDYESTLLEMASILSIPYEEFYRLWMSTAKQRGSGIFQSIEANLVHICEELKVSVTDDNLKKAAAVRLNFVNNYLASDRDGIEVITNLKSEGYKIALISNCAPETPVIWENLPFKLMFDVVIFSCLVGLQKPDPRIYKMAAEKLAVEPARCLYVGDGDDNELSGAAGVGMNPVLIRDPDEDSNDVMRTKAASREWDGPVITSLKEVLEMVK